MGVASSVHRKGAGGGDDDGGGRKSMASRQRNSARATTSTSCRGVVTPADTPIELILHRGVNQGLTALVAQQAESVDLEKRESMGEPQSDFVDRSDSGMKESPRSSRDPSEDSDQEQIRNKLESEENESESLEADAFPELNIRESEQGIRNFDEDSQDTREVPNIPEISPRASQAEALQTESFSDRMMKTRQSILESMELIKKETILSPTDTSEHEPVVGKQPSRTSERTLEQAEEEIRKLKLEMKAMQERHERHIERLRARSAKSHAEAAIRVFELQEEVRGFWQVAMRDQPITGPGRLPSLDKPNRTDGTSTLAPLCLKTPLQMTAEYQQELSQLSEHLNAKNNLICELSMRIASLDQDLEVVKDKLKIGREENGEAKIVLDRSPLDGGDTTHKGTGMETPTGNGDTNRWHWVSAMIVEEDDGKTPAEGRENLLVATETTRSDVPSFDGGDSGTGERVGDGPLILRKSPRPKSSMYARKPPRPLDRLTAPPTCRPVAPLPMIAEEKGTSNFHQISEARIPAAAEVDFHTHATGADLFLPRTRTARPQLSSLNSPGKRVLTEAFKRRELLEKERMADIHVAPSSS
ncbi:hypothetical protein BJ742DRAFT_740414 [Cladochytrium replicatum]|nr:hypothetical protein BJ742DRAFT_740414 [Cladochytrium replicatum]